MNCPKCKGKDLHKKNDESSYSCSQCGGIWLEFDNIPSFFENLHQEVSEEQTDNSHDGKSGICPHGHGLMTRAKVEDSDNPFYLEKCSSCGGIWFDNNEWYRIVNKNLVKNIHDIWCSSWQAQQRRLKTRETYLDTNKRLLGNDIFEKIIELSKLLKDNPEKGRALALLQQELL